MRLNGLSVGSEFTVELPLMVCKPGRALAAEPGLMDIHVLAVTHDPQATLILSAYLQNAGATVTVVPDLMAARALLLQPSKPLTSTVVLVSLAITAPTDTLDLPPAAGVVRMMVRGDHTPGPDITLFVRPLLYDDLVHAVTVASGRLGRLAPEQTHERRSQPARPSAPSVADAVNSNRLILLAEDNETNRDVMQEQLHLLGYTCEIAEDGAIALQMWQRDPGRYALLLSDCHMPHLDGFGLTEAIRQAEPAGSHLPIIAVTANAMQGEAQRCRERGMDDYLSKPLRMNELALTLKKWLPLTDAASPEPTAATPTPISAARVDGHDAQTNAALPIWNPTTLTELVGDNPGMHRRLLDKFLINAEKQVADILAAVAAGDTGTLTSIAHTLKSAARSVGAFALGEVCQNLEAAGPAGNRQQCDALAAELVSEFSAASDNIQTS